MIRSILRWSVLTDGPPVISTAMAKKTKIEKVNALAELDRIGWKWEAAGADEVRMLCPAHEDKTPSCNMNVKKNLWKCHSAACGAKGDIVGFLAYALRVERGTVLADLGKRYDIEDVRTINPERVEEYHSKIWTAGPLLTALHDRGITDDMIRSARLGYTDGRIMIPVFDTEGRCVNIRKYLPGAPGPEKMKNTPGYGDPKFYQVDQLRFPVIWLCGGEMKALIAGAMLNSHDIGAISVTAGEGSWHEKLTPQLAGKHVLLCYDVDEGGKRGGDKAAANFWSTAASIRVIDLPLDKAKYPKGDINDYVGQEHATTDDLLALMQSARTWSPANGFVEEIEDDPAKIKDLRLVESNKAENIGTRIRFEAVTTAELPTPYLVPREIGVKCTKDQPNCPWCPVKNKEPNPDTSFVHLKIKSTSRSMLEMINSPKSHQPEAIREGLLIPTCKVVEFVVRDHYDISELLLSPQLKIGGQASEYVMQPAFVVGSPPDLNTPYRFSGKLHPHPKNQQAILLLDGMTQIEDNLHSYAPGEDELTRLQMFQPATWAVDGLQSQLDKVYTDMESNVTRIYHRRDLHLTFDLAYHSPLFLRFDQQTIKGWLNVLVAGDSSQGKSEASSRMMEHYGLGERVECKNASVAGLLGGLQQIGTRWFVSWGVIPTHDRRLVILEEVKGTSVEVLAKLTDMRSSGMAELPKIEKRRTYARTRLIFISNPRSDRPMSAYNFGIEAIKELIGGPEDIRRFDFALLVSASQIDARDINRLSTHRPHIEHEFTAELCRKLVLWAWTRDPARVEFESAATDAILRNATALCSVFTEAMPLVDRGTMRHKLARLAAALAARTFSTAEDDQQTLLVRECHVDFIAQFIDRVYSDAVFGYRDFSLAQVHANSVHDPHIVRRNVLGTKHPKDFIENLLYNDEITLNDISDWCEVDRDDATKLLSLLVRKHALYRVKREYVKTADFIKLLKEIKTEAPTTALTDSSVDKF